MNNLLRRLILGITSMWLLIPIFIYSCLLKYNNYNYSFTIIMIIAIVFSMLYWGQVEEYNIYLKYDQLFSRILFISILLKSLYYYTVDNFIVLKLIIFSGMLYIFSRLQFNNGNINSNTIIHSIFRYSGYLSIIKLVNTRIDIYINTVIYFGSILPLMLLNKYINVLNYHNYYYLCLIYISYVILLFIIITDIDIN